MKNDNIHAGDSMTARYNVHVFGVFTICGGLMLTVLMLVRPGQLKALGDKELSAYFLQYYGVVNAVFYYLASALLVFLGSVEWMHMQNFPGKKSLHFKVAMMFWFFASAFFFCPGVFDFSFNPPYDNVSSFCIDLVLSQSLCPL